MAEEHARADGVDRGPPTLELPLPHVHAGWDAAVELQIDGLVLPDRHGRADPLIHGEHGRTMVTIEVDEDAAIVREVHRVQQRIRCCSAAEHGHGELFGLRPATGDADAVARAVLTPVDRGRASRDGDPLSDDVDLR